MRRQRRPRRTSFVLLPITHGVVVVVVSFLLLVIISVPNTIVYAGDKISRNSREGREHNNQQDKVNSFEYDVSNDVDLATALAAAMEAAAATGGGGRGGGAAATNGAVCAPPLLVDDESELIDVQQDATVGVTNDVGDGSDASTSVSVSAVQASLEVGVASSVSSDVAAETLAHGVTADLTGDVMPAADLAHRDFPHLPGMDSATSDVDVVIADAQLQGLINSDLEQRINQLAERDILGAAPFVQEQRQEERSESSDNDNDENREVAANTLSPPSDPTANTVDVATVLTPENLTLHTKTAMTMHERRPKSATASDEAGDHDNAAFEKPESTVILSAPMPSEGALQKEEEYHGQEKDGDDPTGDDLGGESAPTRVGLRERAGREQIHEKDSGIENGGSENDPDDEGKMETSGSESDRVRAEDKEHKEPAMSITMVEPVVDAMEAAVESMATEAAAGEDVVEDSVDEHDPSLVLATDDRHEEVERVVDSGATGDGPEEEMVLDSNGGRPLDVGDERPLDTTDSIAVKSEVAFAADGDPSGAVRRNTEEHAVDVDHVEIASEQLPSDEAPIHSLVVDAPVAQGEVERGNDRETLSAKENQPTRKIYRINDRGDPVITSTATLGDGYSSDRQQPRHPESENNQSTAEKNTENIATASEDAESDVGQSALREATADRTDTNGDRETRADEDGAPTLRDPAPSKSGAEFEAAGDGSSRSGWGGVRGGKRLDSGSGGGGVIADEKSRTHVAPEDMAQRVREMEDEILRKLLAEEEAKSLLDL